MSAPAKKPVPPSGALSGSTASAAPRARAPAAPAAVPASASGGISAEETQRRADLLQQCFAIMDANGDGILDAHELEAVARAFNPTRAAAECSQEVATVLAKLDSNLDGVVDCDEWTAALLNMFQFMTWDAFAKHCHELKMLAPALRR